MQSGERIVINGRSYRLGSLLSTHAGSYGQVWAATDPTGRGVALKFINTEAMSRADPALHGHWRAHLEREIAFLACLDADQSHHVVALLDHGQTGGQPVLVMERLHANLGQWLTQQRRESALPPDLERVVDWTGQILDGLEVIHRAGFVYRDLKFSNILVDERGALLKLADFGSLSREDGDNTRSFIGTPATMAPEQVLPVRHGTAGSEYAIDYRADYYALGLLLFALLTDRPTTAAQRRLGQLLTQHGQEGAARYGEQLGGLDEEERELLRWSIEFWTVPARPEQARNGAAVLLTELIGRLLAHDPTARPARSAEIRAVLAATSVGPANAATARLMAGEPLPAAPPNRSPRANGAGRSSPSAWSRRIVGLTGACGLAGALAWAVFIQPGDWLPTFSEPPGLALPAPDPAPIVDLESIPAEEPTVVTTTTPEPAIAAPAIVAAPSPAKPPAAKAPVAAPTLKAPVAAERPAPQPSRVPTPARTTTRPAPVERPASPPPPAPQVAKPTPKASPAPTAATPRSSPTTAKAKATPAPRSAGTAPATARATPSTPTATRPAAAPAPAASPVARVTPPASPVLPPIELTSRSQSPPALPPIELTSRSQSPPALPPIELTSRSQSPPAIELVSRSSAQPAQPAQPRPAAVGPTSQPPARSSAPVTNRNTTDVDRVAAGVRREAEAFTDWVDRTSTTISKEVQRGLDSANQALNPAPRGNNTRVERRDQQYRPRAD